MNVRMLYNMRRDNKCEKMKPLSVPYIPDGRADLVVVSGDMPTAMRECLATYVKNVMPVPRLPGLHYPVCGHPDMLFVNPCEGVIIYAPGISAEFVELLENFGYMMISGGKTPFGDYPRDIPYNVAIVGRHAFLNKRYSDPCLMEWLERAGIGMSHVNQGYAKCSTLILNREAVITSDSGINNAAREQNIDSLLVPPQKRIVIEGFDYGFLGGAAGLISPSELAVSGDFSMLDDAGEIGKFLAKYGIKPISLGSGNVLDLGSLIPLCSV